MSYDYISSILRRLTAANSEEEQVTQKQSINSTGNDIVNSVYYKTLEDELVELSETSETDYNEMLSESTTIEEVEKEIEAKQQEIVDKQTETDAYIETCRNAIEAIFAKGTDVIPKEVQEKYDTELDNILNNIAYNTGTIPENISVITENAITIEQVNQEIEARRQEIEEKEAEIKSLKKKSNPDEDKISSLQDEISSLNLEISILNVIA